MTVFQICPANDSLLAAVAATKPLRFSMSVDSGERDDGKTSEALPDEIDSGSARDLDATARDGMAAPEIATPNSAYLPTIANARPVRPPAHALCKREDDKSPESLSLQIQPLAHRFVPPGNDLR